MNIQMQVQNHVAHIVISRPEKRNALTATMYADLAGAIHSACEDQQVRAVLLSGAGGHFTAGNDLEDFLQQPPATSVDWRRSPFNFMQALIQCDKPVLAAVTGNAVGIGVTMLLHCDFVYLADDARLLMPFVKLGLVPEFASSLLVPFLMGRAKAAEKLLLGDPIAPAEALAFGLANAVLPASEVLAHALRAAERFNSLPPEAVRAAKRLLQKPDRAAVLAAIEAESGVFAERLRSDEAKQAFRSFLKR
jgi:enoyl-CoA hydratase/carnithine racemase